MREYSNRIISSIGLLLGEWLCFDGVHALWWGDFVSATSGEHAGQLGPWADLVSFVGIAPRSLWMKIIHLILGLAWIGSAIAHIRKSEFGRKGLIICSVFSLWYLPFGTIIGLAVLSIAMVYPSSSRKA